MIRNKGLRTKKDGSKTKEMSFDLPIELAEKLEETTKKTGISKKFLVCKALNNLFLGEYR